MIANTISRATARTVYNRLGHRLERAARYEAHAKAEAMSLLNARPGEKVLHLGIGTGNEQAQLVGDVIPGGTVVGLDIARVLLALTRLKMLPSAPSLLIEGDATILPFAKATFDCLFSAYLLDLLPTPDLVPTLHEWRRVLRPGGRIVVVTMTEGIDPASRLFVAWWKVRFRFAPAAFGGCRPLQLTRFIATAGFTDIQQIVIVQRGFPSEIIRAIRPA
jgi:ubiquinone/menaquinone biosynthesis C-methylase UbiE